MRTHNHLNIFHLHHNNNYTFKHSDMLDAPCRAEKFHLNGLGFARCADHEWLHTHRAAQGSSAVALLKIC